MEVRTILERLGLAGEVLDGLGGGPDREPAAGPVTTSLNPASGEPIASLRTATAEQVERAITRAHETFLTWRTVPAPRRGALVRDLGDALREKKEALGALVTLEMGKIHAEGQGEVQEMIDICDFAVGLSRQLYGLTMASERPDHHLREMWHPLGVVGIVSAFNFPVAVWSWNSALAAVCGDTMVWKPASDTPLTAIAVQRICDEVMAKHDAWGVFNLVIGPGRTVGETLIKDPRVPLVSATGSCVMGRRIASIVNDRFGRMILELGGNNALAVMDDADLDLAVRAVLFGAIGTAGQRCTTTRRLLLQKGIARPFTERLVKAYRQIRIGDPLDPSTVMGPLVNAQAVEDMMAALVKITEQGGEVLAGGRTIERRGFFVEPTIVRAPAGMPMVAEETFAPILYVIEIDDIDDAIRVNNMVPQGLSSAVFTNSLRDAEKWTSAAGSDCGIANVNAGTSGAEIGGAFGGEKETGGGREAGSDSWKAYMRRQTCTINFGRELPLSQGIHFGD